MKHLAAEPRVEEKSKAPKNAPLSLVEIKKQPGPTPENDYRYENRADEDHKAPLLWNTWHW